MPFSTVADLPSGACSPVLKLESAKNDLINLSEEIVYVNVEEHMLHASTYLALAAMFLLNLVQVFGLMGPPAAVSLL